MTRGFGAVSIGSAALSVHDFVDSRQGSATRAVLQPNKPARRPALNSEIENLVFMFESLRQTNGIAGASGSMRSASAFVSTAELLVENRGRWSATSNHGIRSLVQT